MGGCQYRFNASEQYQRHTPGSGVETHCGGHTYPLHDEPEMVPVTVRDGDTVWTDYQHTGEYLPRAQHDPYCPAHGGTPAPPPRVLTAVELAARAELLELQRREFVAELERAGHAVPAQLEVPPAVEAPAKKTRNGEPDAPVNK